MSRMYKDVVTWNVFKGCNFSCTYCVKSFQAQAKRQVRNCSRCASFEPHFHPERLTKIPNAKTVFVCGNGDLSFCDSLYIEHMVMATRKKSKTTFYWQSKNPSILQTIVGALDQYFDEYAQHNHIILTTLETNRDKGYDKISKAPCPTDRAYDFMQLPWPRKIVTIEPIMDFDLVEFFQMISDIRPEMVYIGYNSHPKAAPLPEPDRWKTEALLQYLSDCNIPVTTKYLPWRK